MDLLLGPRDRRHGQGPCVVSNDREPAACFMKDLSFLFLTSVVDAGLSLSRRRTFRDLAKVLSLDHGIWQYSPVFHSRSPASHVVTSVSLRSVEQPVKPLPLPPRASTLSHSPFSLLATVMMNRGCTIWTCWLSFGQCREATPLGLLTLKLPAGLCYTFRGPLTGCYYRGRTVGPRCQVAAR